jgi:zinc/manganese transport system substrate-binding protein
VASFSILADITKAVGGDLIHVKTIVGNDSDAHTYEPKPQDAKSILEADLILTNGLGFEGWINRLIEASASQAPIVAVADHLSPLIYPDGGKTPDPHAWNSPRRGLAYVDAVVVALSKADPEHGTMFATNGAALKKQLQDLDTLLKDHVNKIPLSKRVFVTSHDAFAYLSSDYGLTCHSLFGVDTNSQPSAKNMVTLVELIRAQSIKGVFVENITNPALVEQVAEETHVPVLGTLYSDALSAQGPATSYVDLLRHNITLITGSWE